MPAKRGDPKTALSSGPVRQPVRIRYERRCFVRLRIAGLAATAPLRVVLVLAGCAKENTGKGVASAGGRASASAAPSVQASMSPQEQALKFAACMRDNGVPMDDPEVDGEGHVNIRVGGPGQEIDRAKM